METRAHWREIRRGRLAELMEVRGLGALLLRGHANFAWYTGGADSRVEKASPEGVADIVVAGGRDYVLTSTIEAPRMRAEQTPDMEVVEYPWHEGPAAVLADIAGNGPLGADVALPIPDVDPRQPCDVAPATAREEVDVAEDIARMRRVLDPDAVERLRAVGRDASAAMAEAAAAVVPGMDELEAAANLAAACRSRGLDATVLLAAADERIALHRHPVPVGARIERRAMLVASAVRGGLYANLTRIVELDEPDRELARRTAACEEILARMHHEATRPSRTLADAFADCRRFYAEAGFPDEWRLHHQGGLSGYGSREIIATPHTEHEIGPNQAFAWNPSVAGAKSEDTFVLTEAGPEVVASADLAHVA